MRAALKEENWDQALGGLKNIGKVNENVTTALTDAAKKAKIIDKRE